MIDKYGNVSCNRCAESIGFREELHSEVMKKEICAKCLRIMEEKQFGKK